MAKNNEEILKNLNSLVDKNLKKIVERINVKNELMKRQRMLREKLQKRLDEVRSIELQNEQLVCSIDVVKTVER